MSESATATLRRLGPGRETVLWGALLLNTELALVLWYLANAPVGDVEPLYVAIPFVWINVAVWAVVHVDRPAASRRRLLAAGALGAAYFAVLSWVGGVLGASHGHTAVSVHWTLPPGWGPLIAVDALGLSVTLMPYKVAGYAALSYLVAVTLLDAATGAVGGLVGLFSCVSCTWPVLGAVAASVFGGGSAVAAAAVGGAYPLSTAVFVSAVLLLVWRPTV